MVKQLGHLPYIHSLNSVEKFSAKVSYLATTKSVSMQYKVILFRHQIIHVQEFKGTMLACKFRVCYLVLSSSKLLYVEQFALRRI